jgi:hypothetical protein
MKWNQLTADKLEKLRTHRDMFLVKDRRNNALFDLVFWYPVENMWMDRLSGRCCCERMEMFNDKEFLERFSHYLIVNPVIYQSLEGLWAWVKENSSIVDIARDYFDLESCDKTKRLYFVSCPFGGCDREKRTLALNPKNDIFYCKSCYLGGDSISFVAKMEGLTPLQAAKHIIDRYEMCIPGEYQDALEQC